jgi:UDP-hydrolysing UDP-N-acetyl-D-glucosamine 2-epimerase
VIVSGGSHLLARHGKTIAQLTQDGLAPAAVADFLREDDDTDAQLAVAYARAVAEFARIWCATTPDAIFIVGDRWEMLAVANVASMLRIPIFHHSGGDITQGSADNQTRYALTTLAHLHFVALDAHRTRLMAMGEEAWRIIVTGEPALTDLARHAKAVPNVRALFGLDKDARFVLATFHPTSYNALPPRAQVELFVQVLNGIAEDIVLTAPNPDAGSGLFFTLLHQYATANRRVRWFESLGADTYYAAMAAAEYMIGNSSSGLWEAPSFALPVVDIGTRQQGRVHGANVVHASFDLDDVRRAVASVTRPGFRENLRGMPNPYLREDTIPSILSALKSPRTRAELLAKVFVDPLMAPSRHASDHHDG